MEGAHPPEGVGRLELVCWRTGNGKRRLAGGSKASCMDNCKREIAKFFGVKSQVACICALLFIGGCALQHGDYALDGRLRVELSPQSGPLFYGIEVKQRGDDLVVSGFGKRPTPRGYVEILVMGPDGESLAQVRTETLRPHPVRGSSANYRFEAILPVIPPNGSTLRVTYVLPDSESKQETDQKKGRYSP